MRRTATVTCPDCDHVWDAATAGFCGWCGALLDSPASPRGGGGGPARSRSLHSTDRRFVLAGLVVVALAAAGAGVSAVRFGDDGADTAIDLPTAAAQGNRPAAAGARPELEPEAECSRDGITIGDCSLWSYTPGQEPPGWAPVLPLGDTIVTTDGVTVAGIDVTTGDVRWERRWKERGPRPIDIRGGDGHTVIVATGPRTVAVDAEQGHTLWELEREAPPWGQPVPPGTGLVLTVAADPVGELAGTGPVTARDLRTGEPVWEVALDTPEQTWGGIGTFLVGDGILIHEMRAEAETQTYVTIDDGSVRWTGRDYGYLTATVDDSILVTQRFIQPTDEDGPPTIDTVVRDAATGRERWTYQMNGWGMITTAGGLVLQLEPDEGRLVAREPLDGTVRWQRTSSSQVRLAPVVPEHVPFLWGAGVTNGRGPIIAMLDGALARLDPATGKTLWQQPLEAAHEPLGVYGDRIALIRLDDGISVGIRSVRTGAEFVRVRAGDGQPASLDPLVISDGQHLFRIRDDLLSREATDG